MIAWPAHSGVLFVAVHVGVGRVGHFVMTVWMPSMSSPRRDVGGDECPAPPRSPRRPGGADPLCDRREGQQRMPAAWSLRELIRADFRP